MMTSLFRRSGGGGNHGDTAHHGGGDDPASGELSNNNDRGRPGGRQVRRLEFHQAMEDFRTMFPGVEEEVIECVLRANQGGVDATVDQLLQMSLDDGRGGASDDSSDSEDSIIPPEILERTLEPDSSDEEPPPVYSPPSYDMHIYDRKYPDQPLPEPPPPRFDDVPPPPVPPPLPPAPPGPRRVGGYRNWNPPLLGNLPDDFLRIVPQQLAGLLRSQSSLTQPSSSSSSSSLSSMTTAEQPAVAGAGPVAMETAAQGRQLKQYLEDERIALFLQNEEFLRELQRNRDFLIALERGDDCASGSGETCTTASDDALFRDKLKHMGKSTRKKLFEIARAFSEKTKRRKTKRRALLKQNHSLGTAASTANLLEDEEGPQSEEDSKLKRQGIQEEEGPQQAGVLS